MPEIVNQQGVGVPKQRSQDAVHDDAYGGSVDDGFGIADPSDSIVGAELDQDQVEAVDHGVGGIRHCA